MNARQAKAICPQLIIIQVPTQNKKANLRVYKQAGEKVIQVLTRYTDACERKSCDEVRMQFVCTLPQHFSLCLFRQIRCLTRLCWTSRLPARHFFRSAVGR